LLVAKFLKERINMLKRFDLDELENESVIVVMHDSSEFYGVLKPSKSSLSEFCHLEGVTSNHMKHEIQNIVIPLSGVALVASYDPATYDPIGAPVTDNDEIMEKYHKLHSTKNIDNE
jgi:hypothetical protein